LTATIMTGGLSGNGFDLYLRDSKNTNSNTNTDPLANLVSSITNPVVNLSVLVTTCDGTPVPGATVVIASDHQRDHEPPSTGGELLGFTPSTQTTAFGEAPGNRIATVTTDSLGVARVKVCTATYSRVDIGFIPMSGTWTITMSAPGFATATQTFTYQVIDGLPTA